MYTFDLGRQFLSDEETAVLWKCLDYYHVDDRIWAVFRCFFQASVKGTTPLMLRAYDQEKLCGAAILVRCTQYGRSLFNSRFLSGIINGLSIPFYLWIRFGCCMDMMSNPGFVTEPEQSEKIVAAMAQYLKEHSLLTLIYDYSDRVDLYPGSSALWSAPHALIDTTSFSSIQDYIGEHKNIKKKMNIFYNNGGTFEIVRNVLTEESIAALRRCFVATSEKSSTYLPYQDLYLNAALTTSRMLLEQVYYFVARLNGEFLGYQAALQTGSRLNALHGAFDRERKTTYHAYDLLFVKMTEFALANKLDSIDFGAVINITKQRSVNRIVPMSYFLYSKYHLVQRFFVMLLRRTKVQGKEQMQFNIKKESS